MRIRSSIHAGAQSSCPEAQHYQQKAYAMMQKVYNCTPRSQSYYPPATTLPYYPTTLPAYTETGVVGSYPDRSGWCG
jgi:hypothetical protein